MFKLACLIIALLCATCQAAPCTTVYVKFTYPFGDNTWSLNGNGSTWEDVTSTVAISTANGTTVTFRAPGSGIMTWTRTNGPCEVGGGFVLSGNTSTATVPTISIVQSK